MSESARGEGGRVWVPRDKNDKRAAQSIPEADRWYFLEEWYPKYGNLVPRDVATRAIFKVVYELGMGIDGQPMVYLDLTHLDPSASTSSKASSKSTRSSSATTPAKSP
jgi:succinate dehydrogenase / fumarate reductase flavoprotein subunit